MRIHRSSVRPLRVCSVNLLIEEQAAIRVLQEWTEWNGHLQ